MSLKQCASTVFGDSLQRCSRKYITFQKANGNTQALILQIENINSLNELRSLIFGLILDTFWTGNT